MRRWSITQRIGNGEILAVPSVHFRVPFAQAVNRICSGDESPGAVAVELGPDSAQAVRAWMMELSGRRRRSTELPCMLGMTKPVRRIPASLKKRIWQLQASKGLALRDMPTEVLRDELGLSSVSVLYLSPTDSIVEAIRCAIELDVPLYGVDLEDSAHSERSAPHIQDPTSSHKRLREFVEQNCALAALARSDEIDGRREYAMAARLKGIVKKHRSVLFVCGIAHWPALRDLLSDGSIRPASLPENPSPVTGFTRVLVHPGLAIYHMDLFPVVAELYERQRSSALRKPAGTLEFVYASVVFRGLLEDTYEEYFGTPATGDTPFDKSLDLENRRAFEQLLANLCLVKGIEVPDLFTIMEAAQAVMSQPFCVALASSLMRLEWAAPRDFPELPILHHVASNTKSSLRAEYRDGAGRRSKSFLVESRPGDTPSVKLPLPWEWTPGTGRTSPRMQALMQGELQTAPVPEEQRTAPDAGEPPPSPDAEEPREQGTAPREGDPGGSESVPDVKPDESEKSEHYRMPDAAAHRERPPRGHPRTWPPEGVILTLLAIRADQIAGAGPSEYCSERFDGSLLQGVDIRATLRARARGDETIYVRDRRRRRSQGERPAIGPSPTVFILSPGVSESSYLYIHGEQLRYFKNLVRRPMQLDEVADEKGTYYVDGLSYVEPYAPSGLERDAGIRVDRTRGLLAFCPPCFDMAEEALWIEDERIAYGAAPILKGPGINNLVEMYHERHGLDLQQVDWPVLLVRAAIPYARGLVNVVSEQGVRLPEGIEAEAARHGVSIRRLPVSMFPRDYIRKVSFTHHAKPFDDESGEYPELVVRAMGERWDAYRSLLPDELKNYRWRRMRGER